ncbi:MAG: hypothetical protein NZ898_11315 [Myxococcota bacterium]|nr:hypothetical protein [Myxococcota bacterium]MDW8362953.1 hypothetical protein [Myxococcales bacterium]
MLALAGLVALTLATNACRTEHAQNVRPPHAAAEPLHTPEREPRASTPSPVPAPLGPSTPTSTRSPTAPDTPAEARDTERLGQVVAAVERALEQAQSADREGATPCEQAWASYEAIVTSLVGETGRGPVATVDRSTYLAVCASLPLDVQRCLGMRYAMRHPEQCRRVQSGLDGETRARIHALMRGAREARAP